MSGEPNYNSAKDDFVCRLMSEHPACRTEIHHLVEDITELKSKWAGRSKIPPWAAALLAFLSSACMFFTALYFREHEREIEIEKQRVITSAFQAKIETALTQVATPQMVRDIVKEEIRNIKFPWDERRIQAIEENQRTFRNSVGDLTKTIHRIEVLLTRQGIQEGKVIGE